MRRPGVLARLLAWMIWPVVREIGYLRELGRRPGVRPSAGAPIYVVQKNERDDLLSRVRDAARTRGAVTELAATLGYSRKTIYNKLRRNDGFSGQELAKAALALGVATTEPQDPDAAR